MMRETSMFAAGLVLVAVGAIGPARAQTASQVTRPDYAPPVARAVAGGLTVPDTIGLDPPPGADRLHVRPSGLVVTGGRPELRAAAVEIEAMIGGRRVTGSDLFAAARRLEEAYARAGFVLARVTLPPQTIRDGEPLRLIITDGRVEAVDASALAPAVRERIERVLAPLVGRPGVTRSELERALLLAGDTPGVTLRSTLKPGTVPGGTVLVVEGRYDPVTGSVGFDNGLADRLGRYTLSIGAEVNGALGLGEVGYVRLSGDPNLADSFGRDPRNRQVVVGATVPLGTDGFWLNIEAVDSRTHPSSALAYSVEDRFQRLSTRLGYHWVRARDVDTATTLGIDVTEETQRLAFGAARSDFTQDRLRVLRVAQSLDFDLAGGGRFAGGATASFGLDGFGARFGTADLPLSRDRARPDFTKVEIFGGYAQGLFADRLRLSLAAKAQTAFGSALVASEQFGLGGFDWLSAFDSGTTQGDAGAAFRGELAVPLQTDWSGRFGGWVAPYLFGAAGVVTLEQPTALERATTRAGSVGAGIRFGLTDPASPRSATVTLEYAHGEASGLATRDRFNLRFVSRL